VADDEFRDPWGGTHRSSTDTWSKKPATSGDLDDMDRCPHIGREHIVAVAVADVALYVRERHAVSKSSAPPRRWAVNLVLSLSIVMFVLVVLCVVLFHGAQLGNLDPGGL